jgi:hypothetical protein
MAPKHRTFGPLLIVLACTSCMQTTEPIHGEIDQATRSGAPASPAAVQTAPRLVTSIEIPDRLYAIGETVPLLVSVTNRERFPVSTIAILGYAVFDPRGNLVGYYPVTGGYQPDPVTLQPGQTIQERLEWSTVTPGPYHVHAWVSPNYPLPWDYYLSPPRVIRIESGSNP